MPIRIGCQTYTWEMLGSDWTGSLDDILDAVADAGYAGIEIASGMIGDYANRLGDLDAALARRNLAFAAFACASPHGWTDPTRRADEIRLARQAIAVAERFPGCSVGLSGAASPSRDDWETKARYAAALCEEIGANAAARGILVHCHPHSHHGSILETADEYDRFLDSLDPDCAQFGPDTGHMARGGQNVVETVRRHIARIRHLHFKDANAAGEWVAVGDGVVDFPAILRVLEDAVYDGWIICEEESDDARRDPFAAISKNRRVLCEMGY